MEKAIEIKVDLGKYKYVDLELDKAINLIEKIIEEKGETIDLSETLRFLKNFDEFYNYMKKKFKDFLTPPKSSEDLLLGRVVVDKVKLYVSNNTKRVVIVFDRRVDLDFIKKMLQDLGYSEIKIHREFY